MIFPLLFLPLAVGWKVLHLADFHLDVDYSTSGDNQKMCHNETGGTNGTLGQYGDYMCDSPKSLVDYSVREAFRILPNPDMILWTGDNVPHVDNYTMDYVVNAINITTRAILSSFNGTRYILPTFGNHDYAPANAFVRNSTLYISTWELWKGLIADDQKANFLSGGYYKTVLPNATFLVLNTNLYYNANTAYPSFDNQSDPAGMFAFMESELQAAAACKNRVQGNCSSIVHVVAHIPPGVFEKTPNFTWFRDEYNKKFLDITVRYKDTIKWMLYGHHHTDTFHLVKDGNTTVQCSFMSPAVTPWFSSLPGAGANNPAFRVYDVEDDINFRINDILTYYVNLTELNSNPNAQFKLEYTFKTAYNLTNGIDAAAMDGLFAKMKTDNSVFQRYINYNSIMWDSHLPTGQYRGAQLCSIEWSDYDQYNKCMVGYNESGSSTTQSPNNSTSSDNTGGNGKGYSLWKNNILVLFVLLFY